MRHFSNSLLFMLVVLLLGPAGIAQAGSPPGREKMGESLNFGQAMTGQFQTQGGEESGDRDDDGQNNEDDASKPHPVLLSLARHFAAGETAENIQATYVEMKALHDQGYGIGNIAKAYFLAGRLKTENLDPAAILADARAAGWGTYLKRQGIHPGAVGPVRSATSGTFVPPGQAKKLDGSFMPPGQAKKLDGSFMPPGQAKKLDGSFMPPGQAKKLDGTFMPPGQAKKLGGTFIPPGQAKKLNPSGGPDNKNMEQGNK